MQDSLEKFKKSTRLHILYSFLQYGKLNNKYKALTELMISEDNSSSYHEEFTLYHHKLIFNNFKFLNKMKEDRIVLPSISLIFAISFYKNVYIIIWVGSLKNELQHHFLIKFNKNEWTFLFKFFKFDAFNLFIGT